MIRGAKEAILAGALTFSGLGGASSPTIGKTDSPRPITQDNSLSKRPVLETPALTFNQEAYTPTEGDAMQIQTIAGIFLEAGANPDFLRLMSNRFLNDFDKYFGILQTPNSFGFQYSPFGKDNPVGIDFYANEELLTDPDGKNYSYLTNTIYLTVGDDGTLFTPRVSVDLFPVETLPEMVEANIVMDGMESIEWESDLADPSRQIVLKEIRTPSTSYIAAGDTMGNLFLGTESITPA